MNTRRHISRIALTAALTAALALPGQALAEYYVPPSNSAANQYTESFPGAGGESGGKRKGVTPADTLGAGNAKRLEEQDPAGKAAAEVAAQTAPAQLVPAGGVSDSGNTPGTNGGSTSSGGSGNGGLGQAAKVDQPQGSSGLGQVLGQATGVGDGNVGLWLPLAIVLTLAASIAYAARARQVRHGHGA